MVKKDYYITKKNNICKINTLISINKIFLIIKEINIIFM